MAHEKNVGKHSGLGVGHKGSFAQPNSRKTINNWPGRPNRKSKGAKVR